MAEDVPAERKQVTLQAELMARVQWLVTEFPELGYVTATEFVRHWVRQGLEQAQRDVDWIKRNTEKASGVGRARQLR